MQFLDFLLFAFFFILNILLSFVFVKYNTTFIPKYLDFSDLIFFFVS